MAISQTMSLKSVISVEDVQLTPAQPGHSKARQKPSAHHLLVCWIFLMNGKAQRPF